MNMSVHDEPPKGNYDKDMEIKTIKNSFDFDSFYTPYMYIRD